MLWIKAFHIVFVVTWFAGLFYLPRLYLYHAATDDEPSRARFIIMERRLFAIMSIGGALAVVFGLAMTVLAPEYLATRWLQLKLTLVVVLIAYHFTCYRLMLDLRAGRKRRSQRWYRWFNEIPSLLLIAIVLLVVLKPFWS
jgi:protoporphyrinogen IX oxidase